MLVPMAWHRLSGLVAAALLAAPAVARADELNDDLGAAIAIDGDRVAIAAPLSNVGAFDGGAVDLYRLREGTWRFEQKLTPDEPLPFGEFGTTVALSGDLLAVGVAEGAGQAWVFARGGQGWAQVAVLTLPGDGHDLGCLAVDDGWVAAGTPYVMRAGQPEPGEIHLFERTADGMTPRQVLAGTPGPRRQFGRRFALAGGVLVVPTLAGFETFVRHGSAWALDSQLAYAVPVEGPLMQFAFDGQTLLVLEPPDGLMRLYTRTDAGWSTPQAIEAFTDADYGGTVTVFGEWAALTIRLHAEPASDGDPNRVRFLRRSGATWEAAGMIAHESPDDDFGAALGLTGSWLWVGETPGSEPGPGEALAFAREGDAWTQRVTVAAAEVVESPAGCAVGGGGPLALAGLLAAGRRRRRSR